MNNIYRLASGLVLIGLLFFSGCLARQSEEAQALCVKHNGTLGKLEGDGWGGKLVYPCYVKDKEGFSKRYEIRTANDTGELIITGYGI